MTRLWLAGLSLTLVVSGCQQRAATPTGGPRTSYKFSNIAGPSVDQELSFYRERVEKSPHSYMNHASLGGAYLAKAQFSGDASFFLLAEKAAQESLKIAPNAGANLILASVNEARHEFEKSLEQSTQVFKEEPHNLDARSIMSSSLLELGRLPEALESSLAVAKEFPTSASMMSLARCKMVMGENEEARRLLTEALRLEQPGERKVSARMRSLMGELETREGHPKEAEEYFRAALEAQKTHTPALLGLAKLEERSQHYDEAVQWYTAAFTYTQNPAFLGEIAHLKAKTGKTADAEELRKKAESMLVPEIEQKRFGHARDLARILLDRGDTKSVKEAVVILEGETKQRGDVRLYEILGEAYQAAGDSDKARQAFLKALSTGIREPSLWARLGQLEAQSGKEAESKACWEKARAWDPNFQPAWIER